MADPPILDKVRIEAYKNGFGQGVQIASDEAYHNGWQAGREDRRDAWRAGCITGSVVASLIMFIGGRLLG